MVLYDITVPLSPALPVYPGDPRVEITPVAQVDRGDAANVSRLVLGTHTGTHVDAPRHFFAHGPSVEALDLHLLVGPAQVCAWPQAQHLTAAALRTLPLAGATRVLFQTPNGRLWERQDFCPDYVALTPDAAQCLIDMGVRLVGIDYLSVDAFSARDFPVHRLLLAAGVVIVEGLDLRGVPPGPYELLVLPLALREGDGAPARALLRTLA
ncbi:MAG: cyclase [Candidatus Tectimicrobiota bacterium]|nr:MAG: cyclase [Candidatus Tectomicrobia bacterium]